MSRRFKIIAVIAVVLATLLIAGVSTDGVKRTVTAVLNIVVTPLQRVATSFSNSATDFFGYFQSNKALLTRIGELEEELADYREQLVEYEDVLVENEQYKAFLGVKEENRDWDVQPATVIGRDPNERFYSFTLDKGSLHGVSVGDPVVTEAGLVGSISEVALTSSKVMTILDASINVGATDIRTRDTGIVTGSAEFSADGQTRLTLISRESGVAVGDLVTTSGIGGSFPKNIVIGTVLEVRPEPTGISLYAIIEPALDIRHVRYVFVIRDFFGQGAATVENAKEEDLVLPGTVSPSQSASSQSVSSQSASSQSASSRSMSSRPASSQPSAPASVPSSASEPSFAPSSSFAADPSFPPAASESGEE